jgi:hypothetical protein
VIANHQGRAQILELDASSADLRYDRAAAAFVDRHTRWNFWEKPRLNSEVAALVRNNESMSDEVRTRVRALLKEHPDDPQRLDLWCWRTVIDPESSAAEYREAQRLGEVARGLEPKNSGHLVTLATAAYRLGDYPRGQTLLKQADALQESGNANASLRCMLQYKTGDAEGAKQTLETLQQAIKERKVSDRRTSELFREAQRLVGGDE